MPAKAPPVLTFTEALRQATRRLAEAGIPDAHTDARVLLRAAADVDRVALLRDGDALVPEEAGARFESFIERRRRREPVSRILGRREFWGLDLLVTPDVLDPRPDTETLVEAALDHIGREREKPWRLLDLGTGSGAILCALLVECPGALGLGVDRSGAACDVARRNLTLCGCADRSLVLQGDWGDGLAAGAFDVIVSNPPYIETAVIADLDADVREHDPHAALDGGADGLAAYRLIAAQLPGLLAPGGVVFIEVGLGQAEAVSQCLETAGLVPGESRRDLAGILRVVSAKRGW